MFEFKLNLMLKDAKQSLLARVPHGLLAIGASWQFFLIKDINFDIARIYSLK